MSDVVTVLERVRQLEDAIKELAIREVMEHSAYANAQALLAIGGTLSNLRDQLVTLYATCANSGGDAAVPGPAQGPAPVRHATKYPRYYADADTITKVGRGKKKNASEYRHQAPRTAVESVIGVLSQAQRSSTDRISTRAVEEALRGSVPSYQVYVTLSALEAVGILCQAARGYYRVANQAADPNGWWSALRKLPSPPSARG